ncbi:hypothetical protein K7G98_22175, partial [Saccharothrix sp. MB29]|nr:hypothetical protein [Saccharothrix sp. MB29]
VQRRLVRYMVECRGGADARTAVLPLLERLLDALPYYGAGDMDTAHRGALSTVLALRLPDDRVEAQPMEAHLGYTVSYTYRGSSSGYRKAFFHGSTPTPASAAVEAGVEGVNRKLNADWWGRYSLAVLTDAVRQHVGINLHTGKLAADLSAFGSAFLPALAAGYSAVFQHGYQPTVGALQALRAAGLTTEACDRLRTALTDRQLIANLNEALGRGGTSTIASMWFLYNLWMALKALGSADVDADIRAAGTAGLAVPVQLRPGNWWNGEYVDWYVPLSGADVWDTARTTITARMPEKSATVFVGDPPPLPVFRDVSLDHGYSRSLCLWGRLDKYRPHSDSCLGRGTEVLMADGSVRPVEEIRTGDEVTTDRGTGRVVLVESPKRAGRTLYSVNGLPVFATSGHPFRAAGDGGSLRRAVDPWQLADTAPTTIAAGVGSLTPGTELAGLTPTGPRAVTVRAVLPHDATPDDDERVYDLVVDDGQRHNARYYVGGPDEFLAVVAETADPLHAPVATLAVGAAMDAALDAVRERLPDPHLLPAALATTPALTGMADAARRAARLEPRHTHPVPGARGGALPARRSVGRARLRGGEPPGPAVRSCPAPLRGSRHGPATGRRPVHRPGPGRRTVGDLPLDVTAELRLELEVPGRDDDPDRVQRLPVAGRTASRRGGSPWTRRSTSAGATTHRDRRS